MERQRTDVPTLVFAAAGIAAAAVLPFIRARPNRIADGVARLLSDVRYEALYHDDVGATLASVNDIVARRSTRGMFVTLGARSGLMKGERQRFLEHEWPRVSATIERLGLDAQELLRRRKVVSD